MNKIDQIEDFTSKAQLSGVLSSKIKSFFQHKFTENFIYDNDSIIDDLSDELAFKVIKTVFENALRMFEIFHNNPPIQFINAMVLNLKALYLDEIGYHVYKFGVPAEEIYLMISGRVTMKDEDGNECITYGNGTYYGEVEVFFDEMRMFDVVTKKPCEILFINKDEFKNILKSFPKIFESEIYKAYKRRHFYVSVVNKFRRNKLIKMGKISMTKNFINVSGKDHPENEDGDLDSDDSLKIHKVTKHSENPNMKKFQSRRENLNNLIHLRNDVGVLREGKQKEQGVDSVIDKIDANNLNIDMNELSVIKDQLQVFNKEFNKHLKNLKTSLAKINKKN
jgi:hypothetical protein